MNREELRIHLEERINFFWAEYDRLQDDPEELAKVEVSRQAIEQYISGAHFVIQIIDEGGFKVVEHPLSKYHKGVDVVPNWDMSREELRAYLELQLNNNRKLAHVAEIQLDALGYDIPRIDVDIYVGARIEAERSFNWYMGRVMAFGGVARGIGFYLDQVNEDGQILYRVVERND